MELEDQSENINNGARTIFARSASRGREQVEASVGGKFGCVCRRAGSRHRNFTWKVRGKPSVWTGDYLRKEAGYNEKSLSSGIFVAEYFLVRKAKNPEPWHKTFAIVNIGTSVATGAIAYRNSTFSRVR